MKDIDEEVTKISKNLSFQGQPSRTQSATTDESSDELFNVDFLTSSPLVEGEGENRKLKLQFDVSQFDPSEVTVSILNNKLTVTACHQEKTDNTMILKEYKREFHLPQGVDTDSVVSSMSKNGILVVQAPLPAVTEKSLT